MHTSVVSFVRRAFFFFSIFLNWSIPYLDGVPILAGEGVDGLLLETLLALGQSLVPMIRRPSARCRLFFCASTSRIGRGKFRVFGIEVGTIDSLANSHLCEVGFSKTDICRWSGGWKGGDRKY